MPRYHAPGVNLPRVLSLLLPMLMASSVLGQLPTTELTAIFPPGGKQGSTVEIRVAGNDLDDLTAMEFTHPGITAKLKMGEADEILGKARPVPGVFLVDIASDVPPGFHEGRVIGHFGMSNPRTFAVDTFEEVQDEGNNNSPENARPVKPGTLINGWVDGSSLDYFKIELKQGESVMLECQAQRIDSMLDANLIVFDQEGRELTRKRGGIERDPILQFVAPSDGEFVIGLHDFLYDGGNNSHYYRFKVHSNPQIDFILPPSGAAGTTAQFTLFGRNLPGGKPVDNLLLQESALQQLDVSIDLPPDPSSVEIAGEYLRPPTSLIDAIPFQLPGSNSIRVGLATTPINVESQPNDDPQHAQSIDIPVEYTGQFYPARDQDWVQFQAKAGSVYWIDVLSHRLGLDTDVFMVIQRVTKNDQGEESVSEIAQVDDPSERNNRIGGAFDTSTDDPTYRLVVDQDGTYRVGIWDQFSSVRSDPRKVYRLAIRPQSPDFRLVAFPLPTKVANNNQVPVTAPVLRRGGTTLLQVEVDRRDGFRGEISLQVEGLPDGVTTPGAVIGSSQDSAYLVLVAAVDAPAGMRPIRIVGEGTIDGQPVRRVARGGSVIWGTGNNSQTAAVSRAVRQLSVSVIDSESDPAIVRIGDGTMLETSRGAKIELPVKVERHEGFNGDLKLVATGLPREIKPGDVTIKGDSGDGKIDLSITNNDAKPGTFTFYCTGEVKFKYQRNQQAVQRAEEEQKELSDAVTRLNQEVEQATAARDQAKQAFEQASEESKATAEEDMKKAEERLKQSQDRAKRAEEMKNQAAKRIEEIKKANAAKDVTTAVISTPVTLRIHESPLRVVVPDTLVVKQGEKVELSVSLERRFGFDGDVELTLESPNGVSGLSLAKATIGKSETTANLEIAAASDATAGSHAIQVTAKSTFNNVKVESNVQTTLTVEPAAQ